MKSSSSMFQNVWRICNLLMSLFFGLATYVQINDPDAGLWMAGYAIPASLTLILSWRPYITETLIWRRLADLYVLIGTTFCAMLAWILFKEGIINIFQQEEGREFSGLMLAVTWLLLCRHSGRDEIGMVRLSTAVGITIFPFVAWLYYYINTELSANWPAHCKTSL
ncbi:transmembrane protein 220 [Clupea harengus]|uniref:Transmembrane protein 220 n=1 Tax=Clupea harengus TaxID=7950 RepID=A0A8M1KG38_CLUHA|nr:transmembrane protein 220 [Clupea harengus]